MVSMIDDSSVLLQLTSLSFRRESAMILEDVSFSVNSGQMIAVIGPSGQGKTTLLELISGLLKPQSGHIYVSQRDIVSLDAEELAFVRRRMGFLFQTGALFEDLSIFDNVAFPLREILRLPESVIESLVCMKLSAVGLRESVNQFPDQLSGGMLRRAALARAIVMDPRILLCDEPFSGLDPKSAHRMTHLLRLLTTVVQSATVVVTHNIDRSMHFFDYVCLLHGGKVAFWGTPREAFLSTDPVVKSFMNGDSL